MPYKRKDKRQNPWLAQVNINGKCIRKAFATKKEAVNWEVETQKSVISLTPTISLGEWAIRYLDFSRSKFSDQTYLEKRTVFKKFFEHFKKDSSIIQLSPLAVLTFLQVQNNRRSGYAANKTRKNLVAAWNWGIKYLGFSKENPCLVDRFPEQRQIRYVPPENDFWKVYQVAWTDEDKLMLLTYLHLAARKSELFRLKWEDIDFAESKVRLFTRKTRDGSWEGAWLPLTDDLHTGLIQLNRNRLSDILVFPDPETRQMYRSRLHWMNNLCRRAGVKSFGLHAIRHLTASILARGGIPMIDIQTILRHKNLSTTERYIRRIESIRPALRVLPKLKNHPPTTQNEKGTQLILLSA